MSEAEIEQLRHSVRNAQRYLGQLRDSLRLRRGLQVEKGLAEDVHRNLLNAEARLREEARR